MGDEEPEDALKLHLRGSAQPSTKRTWEYGEHLRYLGIPWCTGLWMLWATGRHADVVGTVITWLAPKRDPDSRLIDNLWNALAVGSRLANSTDLDRAFDFLQIHLQEAQLTRETYEMLWEWARAVTDATEWTMAARPYHTYLEREIAKKPWVALVPHADEMQVAFDRWLTVGSTIPDHLPLDRLGQATLTVAESRIPLKDRETAVLVMMAQWLTGIEYQTQAPLFIRPFDTAYDAPYESEFGPTPAPLAALQDHVFERPLGE